MRGKAVGAILAQSVQAGISFVLQILVSRLLGIDEYGRFAILYGVIVLATAVVTGLVGDTLVVLDRSDRRIRSALEGTLIVTASTVAVAAGAIAAATGLTSIQEAVLFACALFAFAVEEIVRRLLMAHMSFLRIAVIDLIGFVVALGVLAAIFLAGGLNLSAFLGAIAAGQLVAILVGWFLVPREDRRLVGLHRGGYGEVWRYGSWRGLQQTLRPGMFTAVRLLVLAFAGLAAVGLLEAARTYTSPLILVVGGFSSFLFVRFADRRRNGEAGSLREADRVVFVLLGLTIAMGAIAVVCAPWLGPLAFGVGLDPVAVIAWIVYGASVAMVTPYGALNAVSGRQAVVFIIRLCDTLLAVLLATCMLLFGMSASTVPFGLALASLLGGVALRWLATQTDEPPPGPRRSGGTGGQW